MTTGNLPATGSSRIAARRVGFSCLSMTRGAGLRTLNCEWNARQRLRPYRWNGTRQGLGPLNFNPFLGGLPSVNPILAPQMQMSNDRLIRSEWSVRLVATFCFPACSNHFASRFILGKFFLTMASTSWVGARQPLFQWTPQARKADCALILS